MIGFYFNKKSKKVPKTKVVVAVLYMLFRKSAKWQDSKVAIQCFICALNSVLFLENYFW